jgi:hypothetical protein
MQQISEQQARRKGISRERKWETIISKCGCKRVYIKEEGITEKHKINVM